MFVSLQAPYSLLVAPSILAAAIAEGFEDACEKVLWEVKVVPWRFQRSFHHGKLGILSIVGIIVVRGRCRFLVRGPNERILKLKGFIARKYDRDTAPNYAWETTYEAEN